MKRLLKIFLFLIIVVAFLLGSFTAAVFIYQDEIKNLFIQEINESINVKIDVEEINVSALTDFPNISLNMMNVVVHNHEDFPNNSFQNEHNQAILNVSFFRFHADIKELIKQKKVVIKNIEIENGTINILKTHNNKLNINDVAKENENGNELTVNKIKLNNVNINYISLKEKLTSHFTDVNLLLQIKSLNNNSQINGNFDFNTIEADFENEEYNISKTKGDFELSLGNDNISITRFAFNNQMGYFLIENSIYSKSKTALNIKHDNGNLNQMLGFFAIDDFEKYNPEAKVDSRAKYLVENNVSQLNVSFYVDEGSFSYDSMNFKTVDANIEFSSSNLKDKKTYKFKLVDGKIYNDKLEANVNLVYNDFENKHIEADSKIKYYLRNYTDKDFKIDSAIIDLNINQISFYLKDSFQLKQILNEQLICNGSVENLYGSYKNIYTIESLNGSFEIKNKDLIISDLVFVENEIRNSFSCKVQNFTDIEQNKTIKINSKYTTDFFDLNYHINKLEKLASSSNMQYDIITKFKSNSFVYNKFNAKNISGVITYTNQTTNLIATEFYTCNGKIELNTNLRKHQNNYFIGSEVILENVDINCLFNSFDNFNQDFILENNINGNSTGTLMFTSEFDNQFKFNWDKLHAEIDFEIIDGELIEFEPMENLSRFADVNELKHVKFDTLKNTIFINDGSINIPQMDIKSSAFNLAISGKHSFNNYFDYHLELLLSDVLWKGRKKRQNKSQLGEIEDDGTANRMLFISIQGTPENYSTGYDKKRVKQKIKGDISEEKKELKKLFREEFKIFKKDSTLNRFNEKDEEFPAFEFEEDL